MTRMSAKRISVSLAALGALGCGLLNVYSVLGPGVPARLLWLERLLPIEFVHASRSVTLLLGLALVASSFHVWKRKRRAWWLVLGLAAASFFSHLGKGGDFEEASVSLLLVGMLLYARRQFTVRSGELRWTQLALQAGAVSLLVVLYGVVGFWLLDPRQFGINFHWYEAVESALRLLTFQSDPRLIPKTRYAAWFVDSMTLAAAAAFLSLAYAVFRPVYYRFHVRPEEMARARALLEAYGRSASDFFKASPDKSFFFTRDGQAFLAYRVAGGFAVVLGDPVGPSESIAGAIADFKAFCQDNDWGLGFHQASSDFLELYREAGFHTLKIGDDAIVDLEHFSLEGKAAKEFRSKVNQIEKAGIHALYQEPPISGELMGQIREVSDEWLQIPGRRERQFTLGQFSEDYVRTTPVFAAADPSGKVLAFVNIIPSYRKGEATADLMRRREEGPNGIMDYVFVKLFLEQKARGYRRFSLGMAPMAGFREDEEARPQERALHAFFQHLNFLFSFKGLRAYKAKFATTWEPRYAVYRNVADLPRLAYALSQVSTLREGGSQ